MTVYNYCASFVSIRHADGRKERGKENSATSFLVLTISIVTEKYMQQTSININHINTQ
jgi:hypothetical protein